jgi:hypothetical protein
VPASKKEDQAMQISRAPSVNQISPSKEPADVSPGEQRVASAASKVINPGIKLPQKISKGA